MPKDAPGADDVVFGQVTAGNAFRVMAYDIPVQGGSVPAGQGRSIPAGQGGSIPAGLTNRADGVSTTTEKFFLSLRGESVAEVRVFWDKLAVGATIIESYGPTQWAPAFGMLTDRYGITWILDVAAS